MRETWTLDELNLDYSITIAPMHQSSEPTLALLLRNHFVCRVSGFMRYICHPSFFVSNKRNTFCHTALNITPKVTFIGLFFTVLSRVLLPLNPNMSFLSRLKTPSYKNTGSVARDHLAAERTFLAWIRTGLGLIALGTAIERFSRIDIETVIHQLQPDSKSNSKSAKASHAHEKSQEHLLAASLLGTGSGSIAYGIGRYYSNMRMLERGLFKPSYFGAGALGFAVAGVASAVYWAGFTKPEDTD